ncbi:MAG: hypothetical protein GYA57_00785 [Myxococcales bacterium]|nr:hypothetical protein [Myxococcales bacterium]
MKRETAAFATALVAALATGCATDETVAGPPPQAAPASGEARGVCPPFPLRDEEGNVIDPVQGVNADRPYSPRQTCGAEGCHDYEKITKGFHFQQGRGEPVPAAMAERYGWVTSPGNYGGNWCSPAPLYRQLAPQQGTSARMIDMTSFDFVTATCGNCHPGGGPLELDRRGRRYDAWMRDPASGLTAGGENGLDGDYYKARWSETGVIEADCLLCHMPEYDYGKRNAQLAALNFRWAATAGAGFGAVEGKVADGGTPVVAYDASRFDEQGNVRVHIAPEPRNETCLNCHFKPDWKKRGAAYSTRTDVHMMAGLRCVDCHAAGSRAVDPRIAGREEHQFGKGDDPSGWVRNDLDDTVRTCEDCHLDGWRNAPRATHEWLPPLHLESLSCQACHIPARAVKSALVQASDVYNPAPRITPPPKHIWTFYDQEMAFWNHYGELELFTGKDEPTNVTRPTLIRYKGRIYPANRVHSAWVGYEEAGKPGLNQLFMKDFFQMWTQHRADPAAKYPELAQITDDNHDGVLEVNRPEEIDALLAATRTYLGDTGFPLDGRRLVWVSDTRAYYSSTEWRALPHEEWEATPYASVYKFSHDVAPARAALGAGGCIDCHRSGSPFFAGPVLDVPFSAVDGRPRWVPNYRILGLSAFWVQLGAFREQWMKPALYALLAAALFLAGLLLLRRLALRSDVLPPALVRRSTWVLFVAGLTAAVLAAVFAPDLLEYMTVRRFTLDANHAWIGLGVLAGTIGLLLGYRPTDGRLGRIVTVGTRVVWVLVGLTVLAGALMLLKPGGLSAVARLSYTTFDAGLVLLALADVGLLLNHLGRNA